MTVLIAILSALAYTTVGLYSARHLYGQWRAREIDRWCRSYGSELEGAIDNFGHFDKPLYIAAALMAATFWPITLLGHMVIRFLDSTPVRSRAEMEAESQRQADRIAELECELGIQQPAPPDTWGWDAQLEILKRIKPRSL